MMTFAAWHPLVVHFPIALLIAAVTFDLAALLFPRANLFQAALYTQVLGTLGAVAAFLTGKEAEEAAEKIAGIEPFLERHEDLGKYVMVAAIAMLAIRLGFAWRHWTQGLASRAALALLSFALAVLVGVTGHTGGKLVYEFGAGVSPSAAPAIERAPQPE